MTVALAATEYGTPGGVPPLAILHGLFGSGRNWATIARSLAATRPVIAFDLRNHGASPWAAEMDYTAMADDVLAALAARGHRRAALLGHSMGGKVAMIAALRRADAVERLVVADIAPVTYPPHHAQLVEAMRGLDLAAVTRRSDADTALAAAVPDPGERGFLLQNLMLENGAARWRLNLAAIAPAMNGLGGFPATAAASYPGPTLFVAGAASDFVLPEHEAAIRQHFPRAVIARIAGAGHWLHAEQPQAFLAQVAPFLDAGINPASGGG